MVDVTQFSRQKELERSTVDLHESLERSIDLVSDKILEKNTTVEKQFAGNTIMGQWDPYQLRQVFVNVIANAVDASHENSEVLISTELLRPDNGWQRTAPRSITRASPSRITAGEWTRPRAIGSLSHSSQPRSGTGLGLGDCEADRRTAWRADQRRQRAWARFQVPHRLTRHQSALIRVNAFSPP